MTVGFIHETKTSGKIEVLSYEGSYNVYVKFLDTGYIRRAESGHIRKGIVKDPTAKVIFGVACFGEGRYTRGSNKKAYKKWYMMLYRCYDQTQLNRRPRYQDVFVCDEWLNFQNFASWFDDNYIEGMQLDKDILVDGNKIYSPETCCFVTPRDNIEKATAKNFTFENPDGCVVEIYNMTKFCRDNKLNRSAMANVACGISKTHRGWKRAD